MTKEIVTERPKITIDAFCSHITNKYMKYSLVETDMLAKDFIIFFGLYSSFSIVHLRIICANSGITIENLPDSHKPRGYNVAYGKVIQIYIKENDPQSGKIFTILHELYEIIIEKLFPHSKDRWKRKILKTEQKANRFAAYVQVPDNIVLQWLNTQGLDVFGLADFLTSSHITVLIRMNEVLCKFHEKSTGKFLPVINILYEKLYPEEMANVETEKLQFKTFVKSKGFF